ncbi:hypothetical protein CEXT_218211 [Caerostris extrusa]|uniref:Ribosomal protein L31 n=1 Tax=Caerostris extrusa TaxID=172846 RepID=A0AAV4Y1D7_CAEEX|nr:hypothetical protein CEXT_218211 [Caerostris extrusa]
MTFSVAVSRALWRSGNQYLTIQAYKPLVCSIRLVSKAPRFGKHSGPSQYDVEEKNYFTSVIGRTHKVHTPKSL